MLVEQNAKVALNVAKHAFVLETGEIVLEGLATDILDDPKVKEAYLSRFSFIKIDSIVFYYCTVKSFLLPHDRK